jgi:acylphosphatase
MLGLTGYVRNLPRGDVVEVWAEGNRGRLEEFIGYLNVGPPAAIVKRVVTRWSEYTGSYTGFSVEY